MKTWIDKADKTGFFTNLNSKKPHSSGITSVRKEPEHNRRCSEKLEHLNSSVKYFGLTRKTKVKIRALSKVLAEEAISELHQKNAFKP